MADTRNDDLIARVAQAESGNRDYDDAGNVITSPVGAKGRMQVMDATNRDPGYGVRPAQDDSLEERNRVGEEYLAAMVKLYDGDLPKALAAYNAGPGNVNNALRDAANANDSDNWMTYLPKPEETIPYVTRILAADGLEKPAQAAQKRPTPEVRGELGETYENTVTSLWDSLATDNAKGRPIKEPTLSPMNADMMASMVQPSPELHSEVVMREQENQQAWADGISFLDKVAASYDETLFPLLGRQKDKPWNFNDENFDSVAKYRSVADTITDPDDIQAIMDSGNEARADWVIKDVARRKENEKVLGTGTFLGSMAAGMVGMGLDPSTYLFGYGGMKAAALAGKTGYAYYALGGAAGNVSYDAIRASIGGDVGAEDLIASAALGAGLGMAGYRFSGARTGYQLERANEIAKAGAEARAKHLDEAATELGPQATPEQVSARATEIAGERLQRTLDISLAAPDQRDMIIPSAEEAARLPDVNPAAAQRPTGIRRVLSDLGDLVRGKDLADPDGLDHIPSGEVREAVRTIMRQAEFGVIENPIDKDRLHALGESLRNAPGMSWARENLGSTALALLKSKSPVARWYAMQALENTTGAFRTSTASITKVQLERMFMADLKNEAETLFKAWATRNGYKLGVKEFFTDTHWKEFNDQLFRYREAVRTGERVRPGGPIIRQMSEMLDRQYDMMRKAQIQSRVSGFGNLPNTSAGYQPWAISPRKWKALTDPQKRAYQRALSEEVQNKHGWDEEFSDFFARQYIDQVNKWVNGGVHASAMPNESAVDVLSKALKARGMPDGEILKHLRDFTTGGRRQTKGRLERNLLTPYSDGAGGTITLADIMETDALALLQRQSRKVSGEVALARHGITSDAELRLVRTAMEHTGATRQELVAFDQTTAELLGRPVGDATPAFIDNLRAMTSLVQLGGMGWAQLSETANMVSAFGVTGMLKKVPEFRRIMAEVRALARGEKVDNPVLEGLDEFYGAIGMQNYRNTFAHQMGDPHEVAFGRDSIGSIAKLIRGGQHLQGKLSFWRHINAVQQRSVAEMAVNKGLQYIRNGAESNALRDMGISDELARRVRKELNTVASFDEAGNVIRYEPHLGTDYQAIKEFNDSIFRGVGQIIQETYVGETGKWAHSGYLKFLTQFRTYSIVGFEKQAMRQFMTHGAIKGTAILLAAVSVSAPIYAMRVLSQALLMPQDQREEFLEARLNPADLAVSALGYTALAGGARDVLDIGGTVLGYDVPASPRTPRGGALSSLIPAASLAEGAIGAAQSVAPRTLSDGSFGSRDLTAPLRMLPFGRTPFLAPVINALTSD